MTEEPRAEAQAASPFESAAGPPPAPLAPSAPPAGVATTQGLQIPSPRSATSALPPRALLPGLSPGAAARSGMSYGGSFASSYGCAFLPAGVSLPVPLAGPFGCLHLGSSPPLPAPISLFQAPAGTGSGLASGSGPRAGTGTALQAAPGLGASASLPLGLARGLIAAAPSTAAVPSLTIAPLDLQSSLAGSGAGRFGSSADSEGALFHGRACDRVPDAPLGTSAPSPSTVLPHAARLDMLNLDGGDGRARARPALLPPLQLGRKGGAGAGVSKKVAGATRCLPLETFLVLASSSLGSQGYKGL